MNDQDRLNDTPEKLAVRLALADQPEKPDWHRLAEKPAEAMPVRLALAQHFMGQIYQSWVTDDRERGDEPAKEQSLEAMAELALMMADRLLEAHKANPIGNL